MRSNLAGCHMSPDRNARFFRGLADFNIKCFAIGSFVNSKVCGLRFLGDVPTIRRATRIHRIHFSAPVVVGISNVGGRNIIVVPNGD